MYNSTSNRFDYVDIVIDNSFIGNISGNQFHSPTKDNKQFTPKNHRTAIMMKGKSQDIIISKNIFNAKGVSVVRDEKHENISIINNIYSNQLVD